MKRKIDIDFIIVPKSFERTQPSTKKMNAVRDYVYVHGKLDRPITLYGCTLIDGYIRYLIAKEFGFRQVPCVFASKRALNTNKKVPHTFITGVFDGCSKQYTWKVKRRWGIFNEPLIRAGDRVLVKSRSKHGNDTAVVTVSGVFSSSNPDLYNRHKPIVKRLKGASDQCRRK